MTKVEAHCQTFALKRARALAGATVTASRRDLITPEPLLANRINERNERAPALHGRAHGLPPTLHNSTTHFCYNVTFPALDRRNVLPAV